MQGLQGPNLNAFSCTRVVWHNAIAAYVATDILKEAGDGKLVELKDALKDAEGPEQKRLYKLVKEEMERLARMHDNLGLLKEALDHEVEFAHFAARDFGTAKSMEGVSYFNEELENVWDAVVKEQEKVKKGKAKKEGLTLKAKKAAGGGGGAGPSGAPYRIPKLPHFQKGQGSQQQQQPQAQPAAGGYQAQGALRPDKKPSAKFPCFLCNSTDHWHKLCPKRLQLQ